MKFEHPCNRCGFCCLIQVCPVGLSVFGGAKNRPCPALQWDGEKSSCGLITGQPTEADKETAAGFIGVGTGCDISAKALRNGVAYDFASLPDETKTALAQQQRAGMIRTFYKK